MVNLIEFEDYELLKQSSLFCEKVNDYVQLLGLDLMQVENFKCEYQDMVLLLSESEIIHENDINFIRTRLQNFKVSFSFLAQVCRNSERYTNFIGGDLGLENNVVNLNCNFNTPDIEIGRGSDGHPVLNWKKGIYQGIEIWKDVGRGRGYEKLQRCYNRQFIDCTPLPPSDEGEVWKYCAIYIMGDEFTGYWSKEAEIFVGGNK
jgi:hypothetical protein